MKAEEAVKKAATQALQDQARKSSGKNEELLTSKDLARQGFLGVSHHKTIELWVRKKGLPCVRVGRNLRFRLSDVRRWVEQRKEG